MQVSVKKNAQKVDFILKRHVVSLFG
jgi:hypothetical protein